MDIMLRNIRNCSYAFTFFVLLIGTDLETLVILLIILVSVGLLAFYVTRYLLLRTMENLSSETVHRIAIAAAIILPILILGSFVFIIVSVLDG